LTGPGTLIHRFSTAVENEPPDYELEEEAKSVEREGKDTNRVGAGQGSRDPDTAQGVPLDVG
jgi:hypothetical protein